MMSCMLLFLGEDLLKAHVVKCVAQTVQVCMYVSLYVCTGVI